MFKFFKTNKIIKYKGTIDVRFYKSLQVRRKNQKFPNNDDKINSVNKNSEKLIYVITDKFSVKPEKEIKLKKVYEENFKSLRKTENRSESSNLANEKETGSFKYFKEITNLNKVKFYSLFDLWHLVVKYTKNVFLPRDYPNSVRKGYLGYINYSFLAGICFYSMTFLSTQVLINTLGVTASKNASFTLSAGFNWVIKDSIGQLGSIIFSAKYSNSIEMNIKKWRLISLYIYDLGILLEISTMLQPNYFLIIASISTICIQYL